MKFFKQFQVKAFVKDQYCTIKCVCKWNNKRAFDRFDRLLQ